ncbi:sensor histidine kinase [Brevundimonas bullata]|uniref:sensor histidine kinase n=1 Tax=Brevundimonas bullata TaxID=13160 RepID=UPI0021AA3016|nr:HWE histidine kinase domain-containing protein [Brevundimonas bullata]
MLHEDSLAARIIRRLRGYGIVTCRSDGRVTRWLADAEAVTGYEAAEIIGADIGLIFTEADRAAGVPLHEIETARALGAAEDSRWHRRKDGSLFWANGAVLPLQVNGAEFVKIFRDETPMKQAEEQRLLLLNELNHRVKNTLATVQSVAEQTLRNAGVTEAVRRELAERFIALSRAHNVLVDENWAGADLDALVIEAIRPYDRQPSPFVVAGLRTRLHPSQAVALSLVLHELITNAAKYGALSTESGRIHLSWNLGFDGMGRRSLVMLWRESGGPPVTLPERRGFGTRLIEKSFSRGQGEARIDYRPAGLQCSLSLQLVEGCSARSGGMSATDPGASLAKPGKGGGMDGTGFGQRAQSPGLTER